MAKIVADKGRQVMLDRYANIGGPPSAPLSGSVDDSTTLLSAATTTLGSPANFAADDFDSISRSGQTLTVTFSFASGATAFTHRRLVIHNAAAAAVTGTSASVQYGHDQQSVVVTGTAVTYSVELIAA